MAKRKAPTWKNGSFSVPSKINGFVEHLEEYKLKGRLYADNVMDAGLVKETDLMDEAYQMGMNV